MTFRSTPDALHTNHTNALRHRITHALAVGMVAATLVTGIGASSVSASGLPQQALQPNAAVAASLTFTENTSAIGSGAEMLAAKSDRSRGRAGSDSELSREESEYIDRLTEGFTTLNDSIDQFYDLLNDPNLGDDESVAELEVILDTWLSVAMDAMLMTPPEGYEEIQEAYYQFTASLAEAAMYIYDGDIDSAATALEDAQEQAEDLLDLFEDLVGSDVLDQRSG